MRSQEFDGFLVIVVELNFQLDRIRLQINEPALRAVLGARNGSTMEVNDQRRRVVKLHHLSFGHAIKATVGMQRLEGPAVTEIKTGHDEGAYVHPVQTGCRRVLRQAYRTTLPCTAR